MFNGNKGKRPAAWIAALLGLALVCYAIFFGLSEQSRYLQEANMAAAEYSRHATYQIEKTCRSVVAAKKKQCVSDATAEYELQRRDNRRDYDDLIAQQKSALWTGIMGFAALTGMVLSVVGVFLVYTTFAETRKANEIAKESQRPWLDVKGKIVGIAKSGNDYVLRIEIAIENFGTIPANHVRCAVDGFFVSDIVGKDAFEFGDVENGRNAALCTAKEHIKTANDTAKADGLTIFPRAVERVYLEKRIATSAPEIFPVAWLIIGTKYSIGHKDGHTLRVFIVRSFGLPNETGFDSIGDYGYCFTDTDALIHDWGEGGYAD